MKINILIIVFCFFCFLNSNSQIYSFEYLIQTESDFNKREENPNTIMHINEIQASLRNLYFDSTLITIIADEYNTISRVFPKVYLNHDPQLGMSVSQEQLINSNPEFIKENNAVFTMTLDSSFDALSITNKEKKIRYAIKSRPEPFVTCSNINNKYAFKKTSESKQVGEWFAYKWIPTEKDIKDEVSIWVCDSIPKEISVNYLGNQFSGGIVKVEFARGFSYNLLQYEQLKDDQFTFPEINTCDSMKTESSDFIHSLINDQIGVDFDRIDFKYE